MSKKQSCFLIEKDTFERLSNAVYWTPGLTMGSVVNSALEIVVERLEEKNGGKFKDRKSHLVEI